MRGTIPIAGSPHEHEMSGDTRHEDEREEESYKKTTYLSKTGELWICGLCSSRISPA